MMFVALDSPVMIYLDDAATHGCCPDIALIVEHEVEYPITVGVGEELKFECTLLGVVHSSVSTDIMVTIGHDQMCIDASINTYSVVVKKL